MPLRPGQTPGHYRIDRQIGEGGMGAVFLAEGTKLDRKVACGLGVDRSTLFLIQGAR